MAQLRLEPHHYECITTTQLTVVYNTVLGRSVKKLSQKSVGIEAIEEFFDKKPNTSITDYVGQLPKEIVNLWKANGLELANQNTAFSGSYEAKVVDPEGKFNFNTKLGIGEYIRKLIVGSAGEGDKVNGLLNPTEILVLAKKRFPETKATDADIAFQKSELRKQGYRVPIYRRQLV